ncbi:hypothetical protein Dsin_022014 [Dipteronia sinensis]|uniref:Uncharacterized protein n=1 Tax=Dipteronia sinensis TaxID=43782 RepID=A0AAE0A1Q5_9ROSI|nr:hypothetical protein Dsin_022014 [Dipteronia sinensis]
MLKTKFLSLAIGEVMHAGKQTICKKPSRPSGSQGSGQHINSRDLASSPKTEKQLDNSKTIKGNDGSTKKSESSSGETSGIHHGFTITNNLPLED